jgi:hypothetical protein
MAQRILKSQVQLSIDTAPADESNVSAFHGADRGVLSAA